MTLSSKNPIICKTMSKIPSRRDFLKLAGAGVAATAVLTGCGPGDQRKSEGQKLEGLMPLGQFRSPPFYMVNGEPQVMSIDQMNIINQRLANVSIPKFGFGDVMLDRASVSQWGDWTITMVPDTSGNSTIVTSGPAEINILKEHTVTSGWLDSSRLDQKTTIDTSKTSGDNCILTTSEMNLRRFLEDKGLKDSDVTKEVWDLFRYGNRITVSSETEEVMNLPGNAFFIHLLTSSLNYIEYATSNKLFKQGNVDTNSWALEVENARADFLDKFFSLTPDEMMVPESRSDIAKSVREQLIGLIAPDDTPEKYAEAAGTIDYLFTQMASFKRKIDFIRSPEAAMTIIKSMDMIGDLLHYPNESADMRKQKDAKLKAVQWLAENDGKGIWNTQGNFDVDQGKKDFWQELPEIKPRAVNVVKLKADVQTDQDGKVTKTTYTYRTEVVLLYQGGAYKSIYKDEATDKIPDNPLSTEVIQSITQPQAKITEDVMKEQGYDFNDKSQPEWKILDIAEIDQRFIRLHYIPENKTGLHWTLPLQGNGEQKEAFISSMNLNEGLWKDIRMLFRGGDTYTQQSLLLDSGRNGGDKFENMPYTWAEDVTDLWKKSMSQGVRQLASVGLVNPQDLIAKAKIGLYIPKEDALKEMTSGWFYQSIVEGQNLPIAWGSVPVENPVYVYDVTTGNVVTSYSKSDFFHFYHLDWLDTASGRMPMLIISPDDRYGIPLDQNSLQLINTGIHQMNKKFLTQYLPWAATAFLAGPKLWKVGGQILEFLGGLFEATVAAV